MFAFGYVLYVYDCLFQSLATRPYPCPRTLCLISFHSLLIEHHNGSPITVKQFVIAAHECLSQHKDKITNDRKVLLRIPLLPIAVPEPEDRDSSFDPWKHDLFFKLAHGASFPDGSMSVGVEVFMEGEMGKSTEAFCGAQREFAAVMASRRARLMELQGSE